MTIEEFYREVGGDYEAVLARLPSQMLIRKYLHKFLEDPAAAELEKALAENDLATAFRGAHTLKGLALTLGLEELAAAASDLTEALRDATQPPAAELHRAVTEAYERAVQAIGRLQ